MTWLNDSIMRRRGVAQGRTPDSHALTEAVQTIAQHAKRLKDIESRQTSARDDSRRAEGQLELIKDLLLRSERL